MPFYNEKWHYSHQDIDIGDLLGVSRNYRRLQLRRRKQVVDRETKVLWRRASFTSTELKDRFGDSFQFKIERNPVAGLYYKDLTGYVLERTWYRMERTPTGGLHPRRDPDKELVAVVLGSKPVYRLDDRSPTLTDGMRREFRDAFDQEIVDLNDLIDL
ncbi:hypothetical protein [Sphingomonas sp. MMS24-J13]|uniref:hypothetical protein n=1 Tax=Sphingomonas sp. MMS24-J13 TaxID=3238686 RepID=UPI00384FCBED